MNYKDKKRFFMGIIPLMICLLFCSYVCADGADIYETDPLYDPWGYILPESDRRYLTEADVAGLSLKEVNYAKNEIYARRGRKFLSIELQNYFGSKAWYEASYEPGDFDANYADSIMNKYEKVNASFLSDVEYSINPNGYPLDAVNTVISDEEKKAVELYRSVLEKYAEGAKNDFATWDTVGQGLIPMIANNPWNGNEMCYAFVDLADDGVPELLIGRKPTEPEEKTGMPAGITMYASTSTNCLYAIYGYENGESKRILGASDWGWHTNACISADKKIWKKDYYGGGYYDFMLLSVNKNEASVGMEIYMIYNNPYYPGQYGKVIDDEWILSSEQEYIEAAKVNPLEIEWKPVKLFDN